MDSDTGSCYITLKNGEWLISASEVIDIKKNIQR